MEQPEAEDVTSGPGRELVEDAAERSVGAEPDVTDDGSRVAADGIDPDHGDRDVRIREDLVEWRCSACGGWTSLFEPACSGCGGPRAGFAPPDAAAERTPRGSVGTSLVAGALLPGLGHLLQGMTGLGVAVLLLWLLWAGGAAANRGGTGALTVVLLLAAVALWAVALVDLWQRASGGAAVLSGRVLARATVAVTGLLGLVAIVGGLATRG